MRSQKAGYLSWGTSYGVKDREDESFMKFIKLERDSGTHSEIQRTSKGKRYLKTKLTLKRQKLPQRGGTLEFFKEFSKM